MHDMLFQTGKSTTVAVTILNAQTVRHKHRKDISGHEAAWHVYTPMEADRKADRPCKRFEPALTPRWPHEDGQHCTPKSAHSLPHLQTAYSAHTNRCSQLLLSCRFLGALLCESSFEGTDSQTDGNRHDCRGPQRGTHVQIDCITTAASLSNV